MKPSGIQLDELLEKLIQAESSGRLNPPDGDNGKSRGILQIQEPTWNRYANGVPWDEAYNPEVSHQIGRKMLEEMNNADPTSSIQRLAFNYNVGHQPSKGANLSSYFKKHPNKTYREIGGYK